MEWYRKVRMNKWQRVGGRCQTPKQQKAAQRNWAKMRILGAMTTCRSLSASSAITKEESAALKAVGDLLSMILQDWKPSLAERREE